MNTFDALSALLQLFFHHSFSPCLLETVIKDEAEETGPDESPFLSVARFDYRFTENI